MMIFSPYSSDPIQVTLTDDIYWKAQDPKVQALRNLSASAAAVLADSLSKQGFVIDVVIMVLGSGYFGPTGVMVQRTIDGIPWVPRYGAVNEDWTNALRSPGVNFDFTKPMPPDGIRTSVNAADYPPIVPVSKPTSVSTAVVGNPIPNMPGYFSPGPGSLTALGLPVHNLGDTFEENGVQYQAVQYGLWNSFAYKQL